MSDIQKSKKELLELQKNYRKGIIKEEDIPENQLIKLKKLYNIQIKYLEDLLKNDEKKIMELKRKIAKA